MGLGRGFSHLSEQPPHHLLRLRTSWAHRLPLSNSPARVSRQLFIWAQAGAGIVSTHQLGKMGL